MLSPTLAFTLGKFGGKISVDGIGLMESSAIAGTAPSCKREFQLQDTDTKS
jgi:hypothetical protein